MEKPVRETILSGSLGVAVVLFAGAGCQSGEGTSDGVDVETGVDVDDVFEGVDVGDVGDVGDMGDGDARDIDGSVRLRRDVELSVVLPRSKELKVPLPPDRDSQGEVARIVVKNVGREDAKFTGFELQGPDPLLYAGKNLENSCAFDPKTPITNAADGNCSDGEYCDADSRSCHRGVPPEPPLYIGPDSSVYLSLFFAAHAPEERTCPTPPRPGLVSEGRRYCGKFSIETNTAASDEFSEGKATFYISIPAE